MIDKKIHTTKFSLSLLLSCLARARAPMYLYLSGNIQTCTMHQLPFQPTLSRRILLSSFPFLTHLSLFLRSCSFSLSLSSSLSVLSRFRVTDSESFLKVVSQLSHSMLFHTRFHALYLVDLVTRERHVLSVLTCCSECPSLWEVLSLSVLVCPLHAGLALLCERVSGRPSERGGYGRASGIIGVEEEDD